MLSLVLAIIKVLFLSQHGNHLDAAGEGQKQTYLTDDVAKIALPLCKYNFVTLETQWKVVNKGLLKDCRLPAIHE